MEYRPRLKIYQGSNNKNEFNPETFQASSYKHWIYVIKRGKKVIFNDYNYSVTTNGHQGEMRSFLRGELKVKESDIVYVNQHASLTNGIFLDHFYETLALAEVRLASSGKREVFYKEQKAIILKAKKDILTLKKIGAKAKVDLAWYKTNAKESETRRLENQRIKSKIARDARKTVVNEFKTQYESLLAIEV